MPTPLPYLSSPGSILTAMQRIRDAATPERVTTDFVSTILLMKGGNGAQVIPFLKKINFVATDGSPTDLYKNFRNTTIGGQAVADGIKHGYRPLLEANEYFYKLADKDLSALIVQITGLDAQNRIVKLILQTLNNLKTLADFESKGTETDSKGHELVKPFPQQEKVSNVEKSRLNMTYTINLNLPATSDQAVFNAIFKSLKEHLLSDE